MGENKTVFVTGASRGIGKEVALKFADNGYNVVINYVSSKTNVEELKAEFENKGVKALIMQADVTDKEAIEELVKKAIEEFGSIDVLVNNAGITKDNLLMRMSEEEFDKVIEVNLKGTYVVTKAVTKYMMKKRKGSIINLSSVVGVAGNAGQCNYAASKAGIIGFTKRVAKELEKLTGLEARCTVLGYMQRGGTPTAFDRVLSTKYGSKAMELALNGDFNRLAVIKDGRLSSVPLEEVVGNNKVIGAVSGNTPESNIRRVTMDHDLVKTARHIGINLGD